MRAWVESWKEDFRTLWRSSWPRWVGRRYLQSKKNSGFLSFITFISIAGVALGVTAMVVVLSVMDGFEVQQRKRLGSNEVHLLLTPTSNTRGFDAGFVPTEKGAGQALANDPRVVLVDPVLQTEAILRMQDKVAGIAVKGVSEPRIAMLRPRLVETASDVLISKRDGGENARLPGLFLGYELAFELGIRAGDEVTLISPTETEGAMNAVPRMKKFVVEGIYQSGLSDQEMHEAYTVDRNVQSFLRRAGVVTQWEVTLQDFETAPELKGDLSRAAPSDGRLPANGLKIQDWTDLNASLFASLRLERLAMFISLAFIVLVASFNIVTTLTLMVLEKKREISILRAMGASASEISAIFLYEGLLIGAMGTAIGIGAGLGVCLFLKKTTFIQLPDVYYDRTLPVHFLPHYYAGVALCAMVIVLFACLYPARRASRLDPLVGIRFG